MSDSSQSVKKLSKTTIATAWTGQTVGLAKNFPRIFELEGNNHRPESVTPERRSARNAGVGRRRAGTYLLRRMPSAEQSIIPEKPIRQAFRASEGV